MSINSRNKGAAAEREVAALLYDHLGVKLVRNLEQSRNGGHDLMVSGDCPVSQRLDQYAIECKRYAKVTDSQIAGWWSQAVRQAEQVNRTPCLFYRADRQQWRVMVPLCEVNRDLSLSHELDNAVSLSVTSFSMIVRETNSQRALEPGN